MPQRPNRNDTPWASSRHKTQLTAPRRRGRWQGRFVRLLHLELLESCLPLVPNHAGGLDDDGAGVALGRKIDPGADQLDVFAQRGNVVRWRPRPHELLDLRGVRGLVGERVTELEEADWQLVESGCEGPSSSTR
jgi:hypothetical protein